MRRFILVCVACALFAAAGVIASAGDQIVIPSNRTGNCELFLIDLGGGEPKNLTNNKAEDRYPAWSPDGKQIAFVSDRDGPQHNIYVMDADGGNVKQLTKGQEKYCYAPAWSPDGKKIAHISRDESGAATMIMDADGGNAKKIAENCWDPQWSPNGKKILFTRLTNQGFHIHVMDADGSNQKDLDTANNTLGFSYPNWSPDGKKIVYGDMTTAGSIEIVTADADGQNQELLTNLGGVNSFATFSPDGKKILFRPVSGETWPYYLMDANGQNVKVIEQLAKEPPLNQRIDSGLAAWKPKEKEAEQHK
jgi:TolB protein